MARPTVLKICVVIALLSCVGAGAAHAATLATTISASTIIGGGTFSPSKSVSISVSVGPTGCDPAVPSTSCQQYAIISKHASGDRDMASNNTDPKIYWKTVLQTLSVEAVTSATEDFSASWTAL